jgi:hypothetical protein
MGWGASIGDACHSAVKVSMSRLEGNRNGWAEPTIGHRQQWRRSQPGNVARCHKLHQWWVREWQQGTTLDQQWVHVALASSGCCYVLWAGCVNQSNDGWGDLATSDADLGSIYRRGWLVRRSSLEVFRRRAGGVLVSAVLGTWRENEGAKGRQWVGGRQVKGGILVLAGYVEGESWSRAGTRQKHCVEDSSWILRG